MCTAHEARHRVLAAAHTLRNQLGMNARGAIRCAARVLYHADTIQKRHLSLPASAAHALMPCIVAAYRNAQRAAQPAHRIVRAIRVNELVLQLDPRAKKMAAFFKMSFSSLSRWFSLRSRSSSPSVGRPRLVATPLDFSVSSCLRHLYSWFTRMPSSRATSLIVLSPRSARRIASTLNSRLNCLYGLRSSASACWS